MPPPVAAIVEQYEIAGQLVGVQPLLGGHINDSYVLTFRRPRETIRFLLQRINEAVFRRPDLVTENIERVTGHIAARLEAQRVRDIDRRVLTVLSTAEGVPFCRDSAGGYWRLYPFVEGTRTIESVETPAQAEQAGRAFGDFHRLLSDFPAAELHETIPDFHNTPLRVDALDRAVRTDSCKRVALAQTEIDFAARHRGLAGRLLDLHQCGEIPERVVHNDAKINNVLFDAATGEALCVVDLDTVMSGLALYDFGDMIRSMTCTAAEDETDPSQVEVQMPLFEALARGYLQATGEFLTPTERRHLVFAGKLITLEQGVRFLTDFLSGDIYYKTQRPQHNLDRCRTQFKLVESITREQTRMSRLVDQM